MPTAVSQALYKALAFVLLGVLAACSGDDQNPEDPGPEEGTLYFPAVGSSQWETISPANLGWDTNAENTLRQFLEGYDTKAFIVLKDGRIALEYYFGSFTKDSLWYWASAGKTLTAATVGIAVEEGLLSLEDATSDYLGNGWTGAPADKESLITVRHQLSMTSGLDDGAFDCTQPACLEYVADAGTSWAYHNGPYTLLQEVVAAASGTVYHSYFNNRLRDRIGMNGVWLSTNGQNSVYFSNARSMARFGLLVLNSGDWGETPILGDSAYFTAMTTTSQELNPAYGYLWWLNGKSRFMVPGLQLQFNGSLVPEAPADMIAGLGKNDQKLYVVPSKGLVVVRMGKDSGEELAGPSSFDNALWEQLNAVIP